MEIEPPLQENGDGDDAAGQNRPHQQTALLNVINHAGYPFSLISRIGQAGPRPTGPGACPTSTMERARERRSSICRWHRTSSSRPVFSRVTLINGLINDRIVFRETRLLLQPARSIILI